MADQVVKVVNNVRYLGHVIRSYLCDDDDDDDVLCCELHAQANMLAHKYHVYRISLLCSVPYNSIQLYTDILYTGANNFFQQKIPPYLYN